VPDTDSDQDGTPNCNDQCPNDPLKIAPGVCGCGVPDTDSDNDGTPNCNDQCPNDPKKTIPGVCGCGIADTDSDQDGTPDCNDQCPGVPDTDSDNDGILDCKDNCPMHYNPNQSDVDNDGAGDVCDLELQDAILILQVLAGMKPTLNDKILDINGDDRLGIEELIYALQHIAGLR
jgi:hypothetical protein